MPLQLAPRSSPTRRLHSYGHSSLKNLPIDIVVVPAIGHKDPKAQASVLSTLSDQGLFGRFVRDDGPTARILLLEYPSDVKDGALDDGVHTYAEHLLHELQRVRTDKDAQRQIHLVGHSTGGLVVKKALLLARLNAEYARMVSCCHSIAFFGVPHRGSSVLSEEPFATSVAKELDLTTEMCPNLRKFVAPMNDTIRRLDFDFQNVMKKVQRVWTFIECKDTVLQVINPDHTHGILDVRSAVVDARSASLSTQKRGNEVICRINRTHAELLIPVTTEHPSPLDDYLRGLQSLGETMSQKEIDLEHQIKTELHLELHLFYDASDKADGTSIKIWSVSPSLEKFLGVGPGECFKERLAQPAEPENNMISDHDVHAPQAAGLKVRPPYAHRRRLSAITMSNTGDHETDNYGMPLVQVLSSDSPPVGSPEFNSFSFGNADVISSNQASDTGREQGQSSNAGAVNQSDDKVPRVTVRKASRKGSTRTGRRSRKSIPDNFIDPDNYPIYQKVGIVTLALPNSKRRRVQWAHVPCNVAGWVPELMERLIMDGMSRSSSHVELYENVLHPSNFDHKQNLARHGQPHSRFMMPSCKFFPVSKDMNRMSIFIPYLHWDSLKSLMKRSEIIQNRLEHQQPPHPAQESVQNGSSVELKLIWQYLYDNSDTPVHHRRSLDQYGYPNLGSTKARDLDQVVSKCLRRRLKETQAEPVIQQPRKKWSWHDRSSRHSSQSQKISPKDDDLERSGNVLMVDQLWCWVLDEQNVLTFFAPKEGEPEDLDSRAKLADLHESIYNDVNGDPRFATQCANVFDLAALVVSHAVKVFLEDTRDGDLDVLNVFEEYITDLTEKRIESFKDFQKRYKDGGPYRRPGKRETARALSQLQEEDLQATAKDLAALLELQDIHDELNTLDKLFREQESVVVEMRKQYREHREKTGADMKNGIELLDSSLKRIEGYKEQVKNMQNQSKATEEAFADLLDMKQRQASVAEAWAAREANDVASGQSRAVLIFTVFTIIFLPLSFFTGIFGMNVRRWSGIPTNPQLHTVFLLMFPISISVTIIALLIAFNQDMWRLATLIFTFAWADPRSPDTGPEHIEGGTDDSIFRKPPLRTGTQTSLMEKGYSSDLSASSRAETTVANRKLAS